MLSVKHRIYLGVPSVNQCSPAPGAWRQAKLPQTSSRQSRGTAVICQLHYLLPSLNRRHPTSCYPTKWPFQSHSISIMSHQPSITDQFKETAQSTYDAIRKSATSTTADGAKSDLAKDGQGQTCKKGDFQDQLSKASRRTSSPEKKETYIDKVASYVPGLSKPQETKSDQETVKSNPAKGKKSNIRRPDHDVQIEEFTRTQYKSFKGWKRKTVELNGNIAWLIDSQIRSASFKLVSKGQEV